MVALRALVFALLLLVAVPAAAGASTVSVEPFREPPDTDPFGSCGRYMRCPADMVVFTAASGETNHVSIGEAVVGPGQHRVLVRDLFSPVVAFSSLVVGAGCERVDAYAAACAGGAIGPLQLGDGDDRVTAERGWAEGGDGDDVMTVNLGDADGGEGADVLLTDDGEAEGDEGDDVLIGGRGAGGSGDDQLIVSSGRGDSGDDTLKCASQNPACYLNGGAGDDVLTGGTERNRLFGEGGRDLIEGGAGPDVLEGGAGADRLEAREDRSAGETPRKDLVDCGAGRRDRATVDRRDRVRRCERVKRTQELAG